MTRPRPGDLALVGVGAAMGAVGRSAVVPLEHGSAVLWATLAVNVLGSFLLGVLPAVPLVRRSRRAALLLGPGLLGGFTTVSAWAGQVGGLAHDGREALAGLLVLLTVGGTLVAAGLGRCWARSMLGRPAAEPAA